MVDDMKESLHPRYLSCTCLASLHTLHKSVDKHMLAPEMMLHYRRTLLGVVVEKSKER